MLCLLSLQERIFKSLQYVHQYSRLLFLVLCGIHLFTGVPAAQEWQIHTVARGENLTVIAGRYGVTIDDLQAWNDLRDDRILVGQQLRVPEQNREWYIVQRGDTLSGIAGKFDSTVTLLRQLNRISGSRIYPGQRLRLVPAPIDEPVYIVKWGDTLTGIAKRFNTSIATLKQINGLESDGIFAGQQLRLRETDLTSHLVERGDALWEIARTYDTTVAELKRINDLSGDRIFPGQVLKVAASPANDDNFVSSRMKLAAYVVERGDNLHEIARLHQMSLRELRDLNGIRGSLIHPGQRLKVRPLLGTRADNGGYVGSIDWNRLKISIPDVVALPSDNGPYFYEKPKAMRQPGKSYTEKSKISPQTGYRHARKLFEAFKTQVETMGRLDDSLEGWHFVLDPGHGGIDPGTVVSAKDEDGKLYYVVEDEYVYDLTLRVYALLKVHGADATMTVLSTNHLLRANTPVSSTFVHDRNEVFNDDAWNRSNRATTWPKGGQSYLKKRVEIAEKAVKDAPADRQVFLSFHADNNKPTGNAITLFYHQNRKHTDRKSRNFAKELLPAMGAGSKIQGRNFGVLRDNPIRYKLLVEMRNLAFSEHIWAIRYEKRRQRDAEKIVKALVSVLGSKKDATVAGLSK